MIVLGLGSNCGDRLFYLRSAIQKLKSWKNHPGLQVLSISPIYESEALLPQGAPETWNQPFLNLSVLCQTDLEPLELLKQIKMIEKSIGRISRERWAPRPIDIDILAIDSLVFNHPELKVPHCGLTERPWALLPFFDLLPNWKFPENSVYSNTPLSNWANEWKWQDPSRVPFKTRRSTYSLTGLVGILNLTPDSFSDGGKFEDPNSAFKQIDQLQAQGIMTLDVGAESTRPGAQKISPQEEWLRLEPVIRKFKTDFLLGAENPIRLSIDTRNSEVAVRSVEAGADWINDVTGFENPAMKKAVIDSNVNLVMMHSLSVPPTKGEILPRGQDPVEFILKWARNRIEELTQLGISPDRLIFDPGLGFGKSPEQSWYLIREVRRFQVLGVRILVGHSRKSFLSSISDHPASERDLETAGISMALAENGVDFLRVHHAEANSRALQVWTQTRGVVQCR